MSHFSTLFLLISLIKIIQALNIRRSSVASIKSPTENYFDGPANLIFYESLKELEDIKFLEKDDKESIGKWKLKILLNNTKNNKISPLNLALLNDIKSYTDNNTIIHKAVLSKNKEHVLSVVKKSLHLINKQNNDCKTALYIAVENELIEICLILLHYRSNPYIPDCGEGWTALHLATEKRNIYIVEIILKSDKKGIDLKDFDGDTALILAAHENQFSICEILLKYGADPYLKTEQNWTALIAASAEGNRDVVELIINRTDSDPVIINAGDNEDTTGLYWAADQGHIEVVEILLKHSADPNIPEVNGFTPLHAASFRNNTEIVELLISTKKIQINAKNNEGDTPVHFAAERNNLYILSKLLENGGNPYELNFVKRWTPLHSASYGGHLSIVLEILQWNKTGLNIQDKAAATPLYWAADQNHSNVVSALLRYGAQSNIPDTHGWTPLHAAAVQGLIEVVEELLTSTTTKIDTKNNEGETPLNLSASKGQTNMCAYLLDKGARPYNKSNLGSTILHSAVLSENLSTVKIVTSKASSLNINTFDIDRNTPLHTAIITMNSEIVQYLLEQGANEYIYGKYGRTALHLAGAYNNLISIQLILMKQENKKTILEIMDHEGRTPLLVSAFLKNEEAIECLLNLGADPFAMDYYEQNFFYYAAQLSRQETMKEIFLKFEAQNKSRFFEFINRKSFISITVLAAAVSHGNDNAFFFLLEAGAKVEEVDARGNTILHYAALGGNNIIISYLLKETNISVNQESLSGFTPLMGAAQSNHEGAFFLLIQNGAKISSGTLYGKVVLHWAAIGGQKQIIGSIIDKLEEDIDKVDVEGYTPLMYAVKENNMEAVELLLQINADPLVTNIYGENSVKLAAKEGSQQMLNLFVELDNNIDSVLGMFLSNKNIIKDASAIKLLLQLLRKSSIAKYPLFYAAAIGDDKKLEDHFSLNKEQMYQAFPNIMKEFLTDYDNAITELITEDEHLTPIFSEYLTPLDMALLFFGQLSTIRIIINNLEIHNKSITYRKTMWTALDFAIFGYYKYEKIFGPEKAQVLHFMLKQYRFSLNQPNNMYRWTIAHKAAWIGNKNVIAILKRYKVDLCMQDTFQRTPLHIAAMNGHSNVVEILLQFSRASLNDRDIYDFTPLHLALIYRHKRFYSRLSTTKSDLPFRNRFKFIESPESLVKYNRSNYFLTALSLIHNNPELDAQDRAFGWTALHWVAVYGDLLLASLIITRGAKVNIPSWSNETPMRVARQWGRLEMYHYLKSKNGIW